MKCQNKVSKSVRMLSIPFSVVSISSKIFALLALFSKIAEWMKATSKNIIPTETCNACIKVMTRKNGAAGFGLKDRYTPASFSSFHP